MLIYEFSRIAVTQQHRYSRPRHQEKNTDKEETRLKDKADKAETHQNMWHAMQTVPDHKENTLRTFKDLLPKYRKIRL
jgi:hypothetical protein